MIQAFPLRVFGFLEWPIVRLFGRPTEPTQAIFLLAVPRSGSTVTYQAICHGLSVNYLSNIWHLLYQLPLIGGGVSARLSRSHSSDFQSQHGFVSGLDGPAEGLHFWQWWLDCGLIDSDCHTLAVKKREKRARYLGQVISVLSRNKGPFASAYLGHALVPDRLNDAFPGAALIRLRREPVSNALSLLKSLRAGESNWFSVVPRECEERDSASEHERVAAQVYWLNRRLDDAPSASEMLSVHYEKLCESPKREVEKIRDWCLKRGVSVQIRNALPDSFEYKLADLKNDPDAIKIHQALTELEQAHGKLELRQ
ncbi:sulfotransferase [Marinobacter sp.]|uniref:sulfotransferase n=1 Tax=Marinobacter sp. TaxID=50741 RepID=UPI0035665973